MTRPLETIRRSLVDSDPDAVSAKGVAFGRAPAGTEAAAGFAQRWVVGCALTIVIVAPAIVQLRYGLGDVGHLEEWSLFGLFEATGTDLWVTSGTRVDASLARPMQYLPGSLAFMIEPDNFSGWHVLTAGALVARSLGMYLLVRRLSCARHIAAVSALLFAMFPAWQGALTTRTLHFQLASAAITLGAWLLLRSAERIRPAELAVMGALQGVGLMMYEAYYSVIPLVPPLLLLADMHGRRLVARAGVWLVVPGLNALRIAWVWRYGPPQYQEKLVAGEHGNGFREIVRLAGRVWTDSIARVVQPWYGWSTAPYAGVVALLAIGATTWLALSARDGCAHDAGQRRLRVALVAGLVLVLPLTAAIYAGYTPHLRDPLRIFYVVAFPAAVLAALALDLARRASVQLVVCTFIVAAVVAGGASQREHWHEVATYQERVLGAVAEEYALHGAPRDLIVLDPRRQTGGVYTVHPGFFTIDLRYLFTNRKISATVCHADAAARSKLPAGTPCRITGDRVTLEDGRVVTASEVLTLALSPAGAAYVTGPMGPPQPLPARVRSALNCVAHSTCEPLPSPLGLEAPGLEPAP